MSAERSTEIDAACEVMHDAYEAAAVGAGWETQHASRKPWADVPEANKATMRAAVAALLSHLGDERAEAWDRGMRTGSSRAMRHMSDEPNLPLATADDNPYLRTPPEAPKRPPPEPSSQH